MNLRVAANEDDERLLDRSNKQCKHSSPSLLENIFQIQRNRHAFEKYELLEVLDTGSMGIICQVRVREDQIGGSAFRQKPRGILDFLFSRQPAHNINAAPIEKVCLGRRQSQPVYALKSILLDLKSSPTLIKEFMNEIDILKSLDHPHIVRAHEVFHQRSQIYLILDLCRGGDLYTQGPYTESRAAQIVTEITSAVKYLHQHSIAHRDLKFENIMFETTALNSSIKLIDFGLAKKFTPGCPMEDRVGTTYTMAPEVIKGKYTYQVDMWSIGVIAFMLLSSQKPFCAPLQRMEMCEILRGDYKMTSRVWESISLPAKKFVQELLVLDPEIRLSAEQALNHPWLNVGVMTANDEDHHPFKNTDGPSEQSYQRMVHESLCRFTNASMLKRLALNIIARKSSTEEILKLRKAFETYDTSKDGVVTLETFQSIMDENDCSNERAKEIFESINMNSNGKLMFTEFLAASLEAFGTIEEERIAEAFDTIDSDDSGTISRRDLEQILGTSEASIQEINDIMTLFDMDKDGQLSYPEFYLAFRNPERTSLLEGASSHKTFRLNENRRRSSSPSQPLLAQRPLTMSRLSHHKI